MNQSVLLGGQIKQMIEQIEGLQKKLKDLEPENGVDQEIENTES